MNFPRFRAPETMTAAEQAALLRASQDSPRDHLLYSMALGAGLRPRELLGLNVGDVSPDGRAVRTRVTLDPVTTKAGRATRRSCRHGAGSSCLGLPGLHHRLDYNRPRLDR